MAYTKQTWASGDTISAARLNHMEDGISGAHEIINNRPIASGDDGTTDASNASNLSNSIIASTSYVANYAEGKINSLPTATANRKGFVQIGEGLSIDSAGVISIPAATTSIKGLIQVGNNLSIDNGIISAAYATEGTYNSSTNKLVTKNAMDTAISSAVTSAINAIPTASVSTTGLIKIGSGLSVDNVGTVSVNLPYASDSTAGLIKVGSGLSINNDGELNVVTNSDGTINLDSLNATYQPRAENDTTTLEQYVTSPLKTIHNLIQNQGRISATFVEIPTARLAQINEETGNIEIEASRGLISIADLTSLRDMDEFLSLPEPIAGTEYFLINSTDSNRRGWTTSINNFSVNGVLSINNITTTDSSTQEATIQTPATLQIGGIELTTPKLQALLTFLPISQNSSEITSNTLKLGNTTLNETELQALKGLLTNNNGGE